MSAWRLVARPSQVGVALCASTRRQDRAVRARAGLGAKWWRRPRNLWDCSALIPGATTKR